MEINDTLYIDIPDSWKVARACAADGRRTCPTTTGTITGSICTVDQSRPRPGDAYHDAVVRAGRTGRRSRASTSSRSARCVSRSRRSTPVARRASGRRSSPSRAWTPSTAGSSSDEFGARASSRTLPPEERDGVRHRLQGGLRRAPARAFPRRAGGRPRDHRAIDRTRLPPPPRIGGTLDGYFDFDLERGRVGADVSVDRAVVFVTTEVTSRSSRWRSAATPSAGSAARAGARAPDDGRVTFVPLAAPGERVRARIEREKGKVAWGELTAIERPGPTGCRRRVRCSGPAAAASGNT